MKRKIIAVLLNVKESSLQTKDLSNINLSKTDNNTYLISINTGKRIWNFIVSKDISMCSFPKGTPEKIIQNMIKLFDDHNMFHDDKKIDTIDTIIDAEIRRKFQQLRYLSMNFKNTDEEKTLIEKCIKHIMCYMRAKGFTPDESIVVIKHISGNFDGTIKNDIREKIDTELNKKNISIDQLLNGDEYMINNIFILITDLIIEYVIEYKRENTIEFVISNN